MNTRRLKNIEETISSPFARSVARPRLSTAREMALDRAGANQGTGIDGAIFWCLDKKNRIVNFSPPWRVCASFVKGCKAPVFSGIHCTINAFQKKRQDGPLRALKEKERILNYKIIKRTSEQPVDSPGILVEKSL